LRSDIMEFFLRQLPEVVHAFNLDRGHVAQERLVVEAPHVSFMVSFGGYIPNITEYSIHIHPMIFPWRNTPIDSSSSSCRIMCYRF
jgi:hypothetical protein